MLKILWDCLKNLEDKIKNIMRYGFRFAFLVCLTSIALLLTYEINASPDFYYIGLSVFRLSLFLAVEFLICGLAIDTIKKQIG